jgi:hypothetical protein
MMFSHRLRFNPLFIGSMNEALVGESDFFVTFRSFNPLFIGSMNEARMSRDLSAFRKRRFNPLFIGSMNEAYHLLGGNWF